MSVGQNKKFNFAQSEINIFLHQFFERGHSNFAEMLPSFQNVTKIALLIHQTVNLTVEISALTITLIRSLLLCLSLGFLPLGASTTMRSPFEFDDPKVCCINRAHLQADLLQNKVNVCSERCICVHAHETDPFASAVSVLRPHA